VLFGGKHFLRMPRTLFCVLAWIGILSLVQDARSAVTDAAAMEIIDKYVQASGGEALRTIETETRVGTLVRGPQGKVPLTTFAKAPDKWRYNQVFAWGDQVSFGFDGKSAWTADTSGVGQLDPRQQLDFQLLFSPAAPLRLTELYPQMQVTGSEIIADKKATVILGRSAEEFSTELSFDEETGLLVRAGAMYFEDYRKTGDVVLPHRIVLGKAEGERLPMAMQFDEITHNADVDDSIFERPVCNLALAAPPLHKTRVPIELGIEALESLVGVYQHPTRADVTLTISRQGNHLMIGMTGVGFRQEIRPESATDFYIAFPDREIHFLQDSLGKVTHLVIGPDSTVAGAKIQ